MDNGYAVLMQIFSGLLLVYAGFMALTKDYNMLPFQSRQSVKPKNKKEYTAQLAKAIALMALAPALSAAISYLDVVAGLVAFPILLTVCIWLTTKIMKDYI